MPTKKFTIMYINMAHIYKEIAKNNACSLHLQDLQTSIDKKTTASWSENTLPKHACTCEHTYAKTDGQPENMCGRKM